MSIKECATVESIFAIVHLSQNDFVELVFTQCQRAIKYAMCCARDLSQMRSSCKTVMACPNGEHVQCQIRNNFIQFGNFIPCLSIDIK